MKITGLTLKKDQTIIHFTDGNFDYETTVDGKYYEAENYHILEQGFLNTLTEYELIESMIDEEAKAERIREMEEMDDLTQQMRMDYLFDVLREKAA